MSGFTCFDRLSLRTIYVLLDAVRKGRMGKTGIAFCVVGQFLMATGAFAAESTLSAQNIMQQINQSRIKVLTSLLADMGNGILKRPCLFVATPTHQGIQDIGKPDNTSGNMDLLLLEPGWITAAVPFFMVLIGDGGRQLQHSFVRLME